MVGKPKRSSSSAAVVRNEEAKRLADSVMPWVPKLSAFGAPKHCSRAAVAGAGSCLQIGLAGLLLHMIINFDCLCVDEWICAFFYWQLVEVDLQIYQIIVAGRVVFLSGL